VFRRDRAGRRGGGVAVYVNSQMRAAPWMCPNDSSLFELLWVHVSAGARDVIVGALYHPPQPLYQTTELLNHIEVSVEAVESAFPAALVILAGDFNSLSEDDVIARSALCSIVDQPTRVANKLDRIYVSVSVSHVTHPSRSSCQQAKVITKLLLLIVDQHLRQ